MNAGKGVTMTSASGFGRLASNDSEELTKFDTVVLGYVGLVVVEAGIIMNIIVVGILSCTFIRKLYLFIGLALSDIFMLGVWGSYYCVPYLLKELPFDDDEWNRWMEPAADIFQTISIYFLVAVAIDAKLGVKGENQLSLRKKLRNVILIPCLATVANLPKIIVRIERKFQENALYIWIYDYTINYLLRYILPFFILAGVSLSITIRLQPGQELQAFYKMLTTQGLILMSLLCYAPFIVNYTIYAAKILSHGEKSWEEISSDVSVRKFNTCCYMLIILCSSTRLVIYLTFFSTLRHCKCGCFFNKEKKLERSSSTKVSPLTSLESGSRQKHLFDTDGGFSSYSSCQTVNAKESCRNYQNSLDSGRSTLRSSNDWKYCINDPDCSSLTSIASHNPNAPTAMLYQRQQPIRNSSSSIRFHKMNERYSVSHTSLDTNDRLSNRYRNSLPRRNRGYLKTLGDLYCTICGLLIKDDVIHFMMECPNFWKERSEYLQILSTLDKSLLNMHLGPDHRFALIMRSSDDRVKQETTAFLKRLRQKRTFLLDSTL